MSIPLTPDLSNSLNERVPVCQSFSLELGTEKLRFRTYKCGVTEK